LKLNLNRIDRARTLDELVLRRLLLPLLLLLLLELDLQLLDLASELLFDLPEGFSSVLSDLSFILSDFSSLVFRSFWLGIAVMVGVVLLAYVIGADVVRQRHYALINYTYGMNELSAVRLAYVLQCTEAQSVAKTAAISPACGEGLHNV
jgi:hypothetical protein